MKKENNIILCGIAIAVLASAGFAMSQGTISSADDNYVTPKHVIEEPKEDLELEEDAIEDVEEEKDDDMDNDDSDVEESKKEESTIITKPSTSQTNNTVTQKPSTSQTNNTVTQKPSTSQTNNTVTQNKPEVEKTETEKPEDDNISE